MTQPPLPLPSGPSPSELEEALIQAATPPPPVLSPEQEVHPVLTFSCQGAIFGMICLLVGMLALILITTDKHPNPDVLPIKCPGLAPFSKCAVDLQITDFMCDDVQEEVERRLGYKDDWMDPLASTGTYELVDSDTSVKKRSTLLHRTRLVGGLSVSVDRILLSYQDLPNVGCLVHACGQSKTPSLFVPRNSRNYCNVYNLLCGKAEGCEVCRHDMRPAQASNGFGQCPHHDKGKCVP
ncbi:hypothetical protein BASA81_004225 [Batrachochytrium salamandrivorans]|nr:hypothetical protein BASA81_004225 [Batrachochytrium salamandrivorans]